MAHRWTRKAALAVAATALVAAACSSGGDSATPTTADDDTTTEAEDTTVLELTPAGLEPLGPGAHYEGWLIVDGTPVSTGTFAIDDTGAIVDLDGEPVTDGFAIDPDDADGATSVVITTEPAGDTDPAPSSLTYLSGPVAGDQAELTILETFGTDFAEVDGQYILATPSDGRGSDENERSGIWFLELDPPRAPGLRLPPLPAGWVYEGWVVIDGVPVSTGRFADPAGPDSAVIYSADVDLPPLPGEDFLMAAPAGLTFPVDLRGATVVISIEPEPDDGPGPFALKPLVGDIPGDAEDHVELFIANRAGAPPSAVAVIRRG